MNDKTIKYWMGQAVRNRELLCALLGSLRAEDLESGLLCLSEDVLNRQLAPVLLSAASPFLHQFQISFANNMIFIDARGSAKQAGPFHAMLMFSVESLQFEPGSHLLRARYREDVRSLGNPAQALMLKMFAGNRGFLSQLFSAFSRKLPGITADSSVLSANLDLLPVASSLPFQHLKLRYLACDDGYLKLQFAFV